MTDCPPPFLPPLLCKSYFQRCSPALKDQRSRGDPGPVETRSSSTCLLAAAPCTALVQGPVEGRAETARQPATCSAWTGMLALAEWQELP